MVFHCISPLNWSYQDKCQQFLFMQLSITFLFFRHIKRMLSAWVSTPSNSEVKPHFFIKSIWLGFSVFTKETWSWSLSANCLCCFAFWTLPWNKDHSKSIWDKDKLYTGGNEQHFWEVNYKNYYGNCFKGLDWMDYCICSYHSHAGSSCLFFELFCVLWGLWPGITAKLEIETTNLYFLTNGIV